MTENIEEKRLNAKIKKAILKKTVWLSSLRAGGKVGRKGDGGREWEAVYGRVTNLLLLLECGGMQGQQTKSQLPPPPPQLTNMDLSVNSVQWV